MAHRRLQRLGGTARLRAGLQRSGGLLASPPTRIGALVFTSMATLAHTQQLDVPKPRIAVCIVGLLRDHERRQLPSLQTAILHNTAWTADVYIETWSTVGVSRATRLRLQRAEAGRDVDTAFLNAYPNLISAHVQRMPPNVSRYFHEIALPSELMASKPRSYGSTLPNLRLMHQCNEAKKAWEDANHFRYDAVVKLRPDTVCGDSSWTSLVLTIGQVLLHQRNPAAQPFPFFHEHGWPEIMVSDKFAVGTSESMDYYMGAWKALPRLFARPRLADALGRRNSLVGERLLKVHMLDAPFPHNQTFCCSNPRVRMIGRCRELYTRGIMYDFVHHRAKLVRMGILEGRRG